MGAVCVDVMVEFVCGCESQLPNVGKKRGRKVGGLSIGMWRHSTIVRGLE